MTQENGPTQTSQPELTAEQASAKAVTEIQALGYAATAHVVALPHANITEAPAPTEHTITGMPEELKNQQ